VYLSEDYIRAAPGGTGDVKCAGNYAASLLAQEQAIAPAATRWSGSTRWRSATSRRWAG
jgi:branched-chain amino acid aminotransferase